MPDTEEIFDVVDDNDCVVDVLPRSTVHQRKLKHRAVHIFLFRNDGRMLIHLRTAHKEEFPSVWTSSASGHVSSGEDYQHSADRELFEELGIRTSLQRFGKFDACPETSNEFTELFFATSNAKITTDPHEIEAVRWLFPKEIESEMDKTPHRFSPAFRLLFTQFRRT